MPTPAPIASYQKHTMFAAATFTTTQALQVRRSSDYRQRMHPAAQMSSQGAALLHLC